MGLQRGNQGIQEILTNEESIRITGRAWNCQGIK
jgi:hypothetical protein